MPSLDPLLKLTDVAKRFDSLGNAGSLTVLDGITLEVAAGESLAIVGPSGSGKSTLLHIIGTLDQPTSGQVWLAGKDVSQLDERDIAAVRNRQIGFVFQAHYLLPQCTVLENVLVPTLAKTASKSTVATDPASSSESVEDRASRLLKRVGLGERLSHRPGELSGGERQRVAVVRALINRPRLLLADEPTGALDHASAQQLGQLLLELNREEGVALIVVTHALELARLMGKMVQLKYGRLVSWHVVQASTLLYGRASSLRSMRTTAVPRSFVALPIGNRRYSRLEICATRPARVSVSMRGFFSRILSLAFSSEAGVGILTTTA